MSKWAKKGWVFLVLVCTVFIWGCGSGNNANPASPPDSSATVEKQPQKFTEPETVTLFPWNPFSQGEVDTLQKILSKKYPNITVKLLDMPRKQLENLIVSGETPDLILSTVSFLSDFKKLDLLEDISPLVKKNNIDLGRFDPIFFQHDWLYGDKSLYGLPYTVPFGALYYNKDIFDRMAVDYPKDGLTWDDTIELGRRLSRTLDGMAYKGLVVDLNRVTTSTGQSYIDPVTFKATIANNEGFRKALFTYQRIVSIPGNDWTGSIVNNFLDGKAAMLAFIQMFDKNLEKATNNGLKWDIAQFPSYDEPKSTYLSYVPIMLIPTKTSKHKDAALAVVDVLTSEEMQTWISAQGQLTSLKNPEILKVFGKDVPYLKGKSVQSIFKSHPAPPRIITEYEDLVTPVLFTKGADELKKGVDVNTVLRNADEELNQAIAAARSK